MTIATVIGLADEQMPNQYTAETKLRWLSDFDGKVYNDVYKNHPDAPSVPENGYDSLTQELLIPEPYANDIYCFFLFSRVALANAEIARYNLYSTALNHELERFASFYQRTEAAPEAGRWLF